MEKTQLKTLRAMQRRDEVLNLVKHAFLKYYPDEDNSWRVVHNLLILEFELEPTLFDYFINFKKD